MYEVTEAVTHTISKLCRSSVGMASVFDGIGARFDACREERSNYVFFVTHTTHGVTHTVTHTISKLCVAHFFFGKGMGITLPKLSLRKI